MSYDELAVDRSALKKEAKGFDDGARELQRIFRSLRAAVSAEGKCWGDDDTGKGIESKIARPEQSANGAFVELAKKLAQVERAINDMAKNYGSAEHASGG